MLIVAISTIGFTISSVSAAQNYPGKPIRMIVPLSPGGTGDTLARLTGDLLGAAFDQSVIIDNRPGANGIIGMELVAQAAADGHTLLFGSSGNVVLNAALRGSKLRINVEKDFAPIVHVATTTSVVVINPGLPVKSIPGLIALARSKPGAIDYASAGIGSAVHLGTALFENMAQVRMNHVPYKGSTPGRIAVIQGEAQLMFDGLLPSLPFIKQGKLRAIAVTGPKRSSVLPDVPAIAETLPGYSAETWYALFAPAGTPVAVIQRLHGVVADGLKQPDIEKKLLAQGAFPSGAGPASLAALLKTEIAKWRKVVKDADIKAQ